ncbi:MAG: hypothetical protein IPL79_04670 [Myxococcales bacterium]|nr:hypothetical protein [Myxococcales bacterium]
MLACSARPPAASQAASSASASPSPQPVLAGNVAVAAAKCDPRLVVVVDPQLHAGAIEGIYASLRWCAYAEDSAELDALSVWRALESEQRSAGCDCETAGLSQGIIKLSLAEGRVVASVMCGSIWSPVAEDEFLPRKFDMPGAAGSLPRLVTQVLDHGWSGRSVCQP